MVRTSDNRAADQTLWRRVSFGRENFSCSTGLPLAAAAVVVAATPFDLLPKSVSNTAKICVPLQRKLSIIRLAEAGCTDAEIQAITNQSAQTVCLLSQARQSKEAVTGSDGTERGQNMTVGIDCGKHFPEASTLPRNPLILWCRLQESNPRPSDYKSAALPAELNRHPA